MGTEEEGVNNLEAELEAAVKGSESPTEETPTEVKQGKTIPYDRFQEVVHQKNQYFDELQGLQGRLDEQATALQTLTESLQQKENDAKIVSAIRNLAATDEHWKSEIEKLDSKLQGIEVEVESGEKTEEEGDQASQKEIQKTKELLEDQISDQRAELLLHKSDLIAERYFDVLPEEYTDEDKNVISEMLTSRIDWDAIESDDSKMMDQIAKGFERALDDYGTPRGVKPEISAESKSTEEEEVLSPDEAIDEIVNYDWAELKEVKLPNGKILKEPVNSEEDFAKMMAETIRLHNSR